MPPNSRLHSRGRCAHRARCLHADIDMQSIIRQNADRSCAAGLPQPGHDPAHPARRERAGGRRRAACASRSCGRWSTHGWTMIAVVEPHLLLELARALRARAVARAACRIATGATGRAALTRRWSALGVFALVSSPRCRSRRRCCCATSLLALVACGVLLVYFQLRARALSPAITEARLQALQARIRPHFLFNSINAVLSLVRTDPQRAETALEDMADLFRVLMRDNRELAPLADEVELCRQYLDAREAAPGRSPAGRLAHRTTCRATRWCRRWCCSRCSRTPSTTASSRRARPGVVVDQHLLQARRGARDPAQSRTGRTAASITPATRWRWPTSASAWRCISTPRRRWSRGSRPTLRGAYPDALSHRDADAAPHGDAARRDRDAATGTRASPTAKAPLQPGAAHG